jgi:hypothetical protein
MAFVKAALLVVMEGNVTRTENATVQQERLVLTVKNMVMVAVMALVPLVLLIMNVLTFGNPILMVRVVQREDSMEIARMLIRNPSWTSTVRKRVEFVDQASHNVHQTTPIALVRTLFVRVIPASNSIVLALDVQMLLLV